MKTLVLATAISVPPNAPDPLQYRFDFIKHELIDTCQDLYGVQSNQWDQAWIVAKCDTALRAIDDIHITGTIPWVTWEKK